MPSMNRMLVLSPSANLECCEATAARQLSHQPSAEGAKTQATSKPRTEVRKKVGTERGGRL